MLLIIRAAGVHEIHLQQVYKSCVIGMYDGGNDTLKVTEQLN